MGFDQSGGGLEAANASQREKVAKDRALSNKQLILLYCRVTKIDGLGQMKFVPHGNHF